MVNDPVPNVKRTPPSFDIGDVVSTKRAVKQGDVLIPKRSLGQVSDVLVSAISGKKSYTVAFPKQEDWAVLNPKDMARHFVMTENRKKINEPSPKCPEDLK